MNQMKKPRRSKLDKRWHEPAGPGDPCPCLGGETYHNCCFRQGELPLRKVAALRPPGAVTNHAHPRCYMNLTRNCSEKISGEHYISAAILEEFPKLRVGGLPWFGSEVREIGVKALTSNILCTRHNSALSPLDTEGRRAFVAIREGLAHIYRPSISTKAKFRIVSGDAFELWGLKTLMGLVQADVARGAGLASLREYHLHRDIIVRALSGEGLPLGFGVHIGRDSDILHGELAFAPLTNDAERKISALRASFFGIVIDFVVDPELGWKMLSADSAHFQPTVLDMQGPKRSTRLIFTRGSQRRTGNRLDFQIAYVPDSAREAAVLRERVVRKAYDRAQTFIP